MGKKVFAILLILGLLLGITACGNEDSSVHFHPEIAGTWALQAVKISGETYMESEYLDRYDYSFTFTQDGHATATVLGVSYTTTYEIRDNWIIFGDKALAAVKLKVSGDTLELDVTAIGGGLVFTKAA